MNFLHSYFYRAEHLPIEHRRSGRFFLLLLLFVYLPACLPACPSVTQRQKLNLSERGCHCCGKNRDKIREKAGSNKREDEKEEKEDTNVLVLLLFSAATNLIILSRPICCFCSSCCRRCLRTGTTHKIGQSIGVIDFGCCCCLIFIDISRHTTITENVVAVVACRG